MSSNLKRRRSIDDQGTLEENAEKNLRLDENVITNTLLTSPGPSNVHKLASSSQLVQSLNAEWLTTIAPTKRSRSNEPEDRNVRARIMAAVSSSSPESTNFLMDVLTTELENIDQTLSLSTSSRTTEAPIYSPPSTPTCSSPSPQSSPDEYDRLVMQGNKMLKKLMDDSEYFKF